LTAIAYLKWSAISAVAIAWSWFCYHQGGLACTVKANTATVKTQSAELVQAHADAATIATEAKTYAQAVDIPPVDPPHVSVCYYRTPAAPLPRPAAAGPGAHAAPDVPGAAPAAPEPVPGPDIGPGLLELATQANAQVAGLQDYIAKVCRAGQP